MTIEIYIAQLIKDEVLAMMYHDGYKFDQNLGQIKRDVMAMYLNSSVNKTLELNVNTVKYVDEYVIIALKLFLEKIPVNKSNKAKELARPLHDYCYLWSIDKFSLLKELQNLGVNLLVGDKLLGVKQNTNPHKWLEKIEELAQQSKNYKKTKYS
jgi:hypothetical protein